MRLEYLHDVHAVQMLCGRDRPPEVQDPITFDGGELDVTLGGGGRHGRKQKSELTPRPHAHDIHLSRSSGAHAVEDRSRRINRRIPFEYDPFEKKRVLLRRRGWWVPLP